MAKVFCGETLFHAVFKLMQAMGVNSLDRTHPIEKYLREAPVFPPYDAGNRHADAQDLGRDAG